MGIAKHILGGAKLCRTPGIVAGVGGNLTRHCRPASTSFAVGCREKANVRRVSEAFMQQAVPLRRSMKEEPSPSYSALHRPPSLGVGDNLRV